MVYWKKTLLIILVTVYSVGNARVIETTTLGTKATTALGNMSVETTTPGILGPILPKVTTNDSITVTTNGVKQLDNTTTTTKSQNATSPAVSESKILDLAFIMDTTGSMGSYIKSARRNIRNLVDEIAVNSNTDLRVALIEYRDHEPQESSFVTRTHDFTSSLDTMKSWLKAAHANGGGDGPEAVADGLYDATNLTWRSEAAKISVLISDAPPHGLFPYMDTSFQNGCPKGHDPLEIGRKLAKREITLYAVGCEPSIGQYRDFFIALAHLTGGQYIPLSVPRRLIDAIIGGAQEELSLQKFSQDVEKEIKRITAIGGTVNETTIAQTVYDKLHKEGATAKQLVRNNKPLEGASDFAKSLASSVSMAEARTAYEKVTDVRRPTSFGRGSGSISSFHRRPASSSAIGASPYEAELISGTDMEGMYPGEMMAAPAALDIPSVKRFGSSSSTSMSDAGESYSTVESAISLDQISRLVKKKTAKLSGI